MSNDLASQHTRCMTVQNEPDLALWMLTLDCTKDLSTRLSVQRGHVHSDAQHIYKLTPDMVSTSLQACPKLEMYTSACTPLALPTVAVDVIAPSPLNLMSCSKANVASRLP